MLDPLRRFRRRSCSVTAEGARSTRGSAPTSCVVGSSEHCRGSRPRFAGRCCSPLRERQGLSHGAAAVVDVIRCLGALGEDRHRYGLNLLARIVEILPSSADETVAVAVAVAVDDQVNVNVNVGRGRAETGTRRRPTKQRLNRLTPRKCHVSPGRGGSGRVRDLGVSDGAHPCVPPLNRVRPELSVPGRR